MLSRIYQKEGERIDIEISDWMKREDAWCVYGYMYTIRKNSECTTELFKYISSC